MLHLEAASDADAEHNEPLLSAIAAATWRRNRAKTEIRRLVAYGREFTRPRPYRLVNLADASGMSISGVRTTYDHADVAEVEQALGRKPREWRAAGPDAPGRRDRRVNTPPKGRPSPDCTCPNPWADLVTVVEGRNLHARPTTTPGPISALYIALPDVRRRIPGLVATRSRPRTRPDPRVEPPPRRSPAGEPCRSPRAAACTLF
ncbi:hypothetical protein [Embleya sp. NPDC059237]|uniref:hypothetical protein n=1 Tax=Embleya sp. NPDC059237 TaxID=3346784 RepID=UPI0036BCD9FA